MAKAFLFFFFLLVGLSFSDQYVGLCFDDNENELELADPIPENEVEEESEENFLVDRHHHVVHFEPDFESESSPNSIQSHPLYSLPPREISTPPPEVFLIS